MNVSIRSLLGSTGYLGVDTYLSLSEERNLGS